MTSVEQSKIVPDELPVDCADSEFLGYHRFGSQGETWGSFEVFESDTAVSVTTGEVEKGFYWWPCFPGCLPDSEANGPFATARAAYCDAVEDDERNRE